MDALPKQTNIDRILHAVHGELKRACIKFKKLNSMHEGYAVVLAELDEAWGEIKKNDKDAARREMIQVAAMAVRFLLDCGVEK